MEELEQNEVEQIEALRKTLERNIKQGRALEKLRKNREFKELISTIFIEQGKKYLWENIRAYEELELIEKGSTRADNISKMKTEVQARLIFERFLEQIKFDAEDAAETIKQIDELEEGENDGK